MDGDAEGRGMFNRLEQEIVGEIGSSLALIVRVKQGGDDDLFDFDKDKVMPYLEPVSDFISQIEDLINK